MRLGRMIAAALAALGAMGTAALQSTPGPASQEQLQMQRVTLSSGVFVDVSPGWLQLSPIPPPPPPPLAPFAPHVTFREFVALENPKTYSALLIATTSNPFLGKDEVTLDTQMHGPVGSGGSLIDYLFYFFFPPPRDCLDGGAATYHKARTQANAGPSPATEGLSIRTDCHYSPTLADFYSSQLSPGVAFEITNGAERARGIYADFYLPPMGKLEANGLTFYVFEAQGQTQLTLATVNHFNFPDALQGAQTDYFWAVGAPSPFPFSLDPQRKNVQLIQMAYAGVGLGGHELENFMRLLRQLHSP